MSDPFKIEGPAIISFSGGRTSAYMLWRILQARGGALPDDVHVTFANTGREMPQTLDFVRDCAGRWDVEIVWLEYGRSAVNYATASRNGEPYEAMIAKKKHLPNPVMRFCTQELKIKPIDAYGKSLGWDEFDVVIGLRADERERVARLRSANRICPLAEAGVLKRDVSYFWSQQNFDLRLSRQNDVTPAGNCDLCFLKGAATIQALMRTKPSLADWWIAQERKIGATFRSDRPSYAAMLDAVQRQQVMDFGDRDELIDCFCGDAA